MQVLIRLYPQADADLIAIRFYEGVNFPKVVKRCLLDVVRPEPDHRVVYDLTENKQRYAREVPGPVPVNISFSETDDADVIEWLSNVRRYSRSDVIKTVVRSRYKAFPDALFSFGVAASVAGPERGPKPEASEDGPVAKRSSARPASGAKAAEKASRKPAAKTEAKPSEKPFRKPEKADGGRFGAKAAGRGAAGQAKPLPETKAAVPAPQAASPAPSATPSATAERAADAQVGKPTEKPVPKAPEPEDETGVDAFDLLTRMMG